MKTTRAAILAASLAALAVAAAATEAFAGNGGNNGGGQTFGSHTASVQTAAESVKPTSYPAGSAAITDAVLKRKPCTDCLQGAGSN